MQTHSESQMAHLIGMLLKREGGATSYASFKQAGILTDNKGLIVSMKDGTPFQITIVGVD